MTKKEKQIESIFEIMDTVHSIKCSKCDTISNKYNCSEEYASEQFYNDVWRYKQNVGIHCPKCAEVNGV